HPVRGTVMPSTFIPVAEETGLIVPIGDWVLDRVCVQMEEWQSRGSADVTVNVNLSPVRLRQYDIIERIDTILRRHDIEPRRRGSVRVRETAAGREQREMVRDITALARTLNMQVVAEGVESAEQLEVLKATNVEYAQGFFLSVPRAPQDIV